MSKKLTVTFTYDAMKFTHVHLKSNDSKPQKVSCVSQNREL